MRRSLNHLIIEGNIRSWIFSKSKFFELHVYYSNTKETIIDYKIYSPFNIDTKDLDMTFTSGDNIEKVYKWVEDRGFKIEVDYKK